MPGDGVARANDRPPCLADRQADPVCGASGQRQADCVGEDLVAGGEYRWCLFSQAAPEDGTMGSADVARRARHPGRCGRVPCRVAHAACWAGSRRVAKYAPLLLVMGAPAEGYSRPQQQRPCYSRRCRRGTGMAQCATDVRSSPSRLARRGLAVPNKTGVHPIDRLRWIVAVAAGAGAINVSSRADRARRRRRGSTKRRRWPHGRTDRAHKVTRRRSAPAQRRTPRSSADDLTAGHAPSPGVVLQSVVLARTGKSTSIASCGRATTGRHVASA